jgi:cyclopropane fatty-acyl-phospholipid synthase-like methyltransferase
MREYAEKHYRAGVYAEYTRARPLKIETFRRRLALIRGYQGSGKLLDLGCACGFMIEVALEAGYDAWGVEFSEEAVKQAAPALRGRIRLGDINALPAGEYDVITAFDILEHAQQPLDSLRRWAEMLRPGGLLVITSPDTDSIFRKLMGSRWPMLQPFQHTAMFSGVAMSGFLERAGLRMLEIRSAQKVMTMNYLLGQLDIYFPRATRLCHLAGNAFPRLMDRSIPFRIGEFIAMARK